MHTFIASGAGYDIRFANSRGSDVVFRTETLNEAMAVVSYLNGGEYPPYWNPPFTGAHTADQHWGKPNNACEDR